MAMVFKSNVHIDKLYTWVRYKEDNCQRCIANCCRLTLELKIPDLVKMGIIDEFEAGEPIKKLAKELKKRGIVRLFNLRTEVFTLAQKENKDCLMLDSETRKCTIYDNRPDTCLNHPEVGPRPGYCAYENFIPEDE